MGPFGGSDKSSNGHRYDTIPFGNGMISSGMSCQLIHYVHQEHAKFFEVCKKFDALIVRCNPGQIKADGGDQGKFDDVFVPCASPEEWAKKGPVAGSRRIGAPSVPCGYVHRMVGHA